MTTDKKPKPPKPEAMALVGRTITIRFDDVFAAIALFDELERRYSK